eukprot:TRINITY_DN2174_c0_g3_i1.p1 TRINITY_DN2174_c0_g3~~TRINITY_DN2174_c0_g3_i1.p1  ORF type:complete len:225 (-),score=46.78 TRINITY_DN2174_c0_g3_i1:198-797(-)
MNAYEDKIFKDHEPKSSVKWVDVEDSLMSVASDSSDHEEKEGIQMDILLAWSSLYQWLTICALFFVDFIPGFGTTGNPSEWFAAFCDGFTCFCGGCKYTWIIGMTFILGYTVTYLTGAYILKFFTVNFLMILSTLVTPLSVTFWVIFPGLRNQPLGGMQIASAYVACFFIAIGIITYNWKLDLRKRVNDSEAVPINTRM